MTEPASPRSATAASAWPPPTTPSPASPKWSATSAAPNSRNGSTKPKPARSASYEPSRADCARTGRPSSPDLPCPTAPAPSKATSPGSRPSNDKCTDAPTTTYSATASSTPTDHAPSRNPCQSRLSVAVDTVTTRCPDKAGQHRQVQGVRTRLRTNSSFDTSAFLVP